MNDIFKQDLAEARVEVGKLLYNIGGRYSGQDNRDVLDIAKAYVLLKNIERKSQGRPPITVDTILKGCHT